MKPTRTFWYLGMILFAALTMSVALGPVTIHPGVLLRILLAEIPWINIEPNWPASFATIVLKVRLPHTLLVMLTGAALSGSGAAYQGLFRNPLADPYLIGVASGAGLGAVVAMSIHWPDTSLGFYVIPVAAFLGGLLATGIVYRLGRVGKSLPATTLILAGVAVSSFATSLTSYLMLQADDEIRRALSWLLGGTIMGGWSPVGAVFPYIAIGLVILILSGHSLNVLQFGEEQARQLGLPVERAKLFIILAASLATSAAVAFSGLIGFIGLIIPHLIRMIWGTDYRLLIGLSILGGSSALLLADLLARVVMAPQTLPVGIITALIGVPFFLWVLQRTKQDIYW